MVFKRKLKDLLTLSTSNVLASLILSVFWLYIATVMEKQEYGELGFFMSIANVGVAISLLGLRSTIIVYESKKENVFTASFVIVLITGAFAAIISFVYTQNIMISLLILGMVLFRITLSGINSQQHYRDFAKHVLIRACTTVILAIILFHFFGLNGILLGYFFATLFSLKPLINLLKNRTIDFSVLRSKLGFIIPAYAIRLSEVFTNWGDKIIIGVLFDFSLLGSYFFATQYLMLLQAIPHAIGFYLTPQEAQGVKNKQIKIFTVIISIIITSLSIIFIPYVIDFLLPHYAEAIVPIQILSTALIPITIIGIQTSEFLGKENSKIVLIGNTIQAILYLVLILTLGLSFGIMGIAVGFVLAVILRVVFNAIVVLKSFLGMNSN